MAAPVTAAFPAALREALEQYLRTVLTSAARAHAGGPVSSAAIAAGAGCAHDLRHSTEWAYRRRFDLATLQTLATSLGARCDHELWVHLRAT